MPADARALDKFYTKPAIAQACVARFQAWTGLALSSHPHPIIEPSAGSGAFLPFLPAQALAYDIAPEHPQVRQADFLALGVPHKSVVIGNPPFGRVCALAIRFFNHAAGQAEHIGFIVPRSFEKDSIIRRLHPDFLCVGQWVLPPDSFHLDGQPYSVPCCFQAWSRSAPPRCRRLGPLTHPDFAFVERHQAHFAVQRVGARAGTIKPEFAHVAASSHHFIRATGDARILAHHLATLDLHALAARTAGNPSLSKREIVGAYMRAFPPIPA